MKKEIDSDIISNVMMSRYTDSEIERTRAYLERIMMQESAVKNIERNNFIRLKSIGVHGQNTSFFAPD